MMKKLLALFSRLFKRKSQWDAMNFGKPSTEGDDFRKTNEV